MNSAQIVALIIFIITFAIILSEKIHRTIIAMTGAVIMVIAGIIMGFYSHEEALHSIDFETLGLLMGMMIIVALLQKTGFFEYVAIITAKKSGGNSWLLLVFLGTATTVLSLFLDNVTTVVLIAPVTLLISEMLGINPIPILMAEALLSDTGGVATLVGDPPNVIIASATGFSFNDYLTHLAPIVFVCWIATLLALRFMFKKELAQKPKNIKALKNIDEKRALRDPVNAKRVCIVLGLIIFSFFFQEKLGVTPDFIALTGAALALLWVRPDMDEMVLKVEWNVLLFFTGLFVAVGGLEATGIMDVFSSKLTGVAQSKPLLANVVLLWSGAVASAVVDNIPFTIAMVPVLQKIGLTSMWWALALGVGMGGNGTPIGSTANIIVVSMSEKNKTPITFRYWLKIGMPVMLLTCFICTVLFVLLYMVGWMQTPDLATLKAITPGH